MSVLFSIQILITCNIYVFLKKKKDLFLIYKKNKFSNEDLFLIYPLNNEFILGEFILEIMIFKG